MSVRDRPRRRPRHLPRRAQDRPPAVDLADLQGNILRGYTHPAACYTFVNVGDADRGRDWLRGVVAEVTSAEPWTLGGPETTTNVGLTYPGLRALGVDDRMLATFPADFREGMAARADELGDRGPSAPEHWEGGLGTGEAHVLLSVHGAGAQALERRLDQLQDAVDATGGAVTVVHRQRADVLPTGRDHFGFADGIAQPAIEGSGVAPRPGDGLPRSGGRWAPMRVGEFVLGYRDEDGGLPDAPAPPFDRNATFAIYRKMQMHVGRFRRYLHEAAVDHRIDAETLAAKIVGRWQDGTPLGVCPHAPDAAVAGDPARVNDFRYGDDDDGLRCPLGAHIRRANPRDAEGFFDGKLSDRHRIIRRGRPYGPPLAEGALDDDGEERGLVFKCFNASIERQFETIQALWIDDGDPFGVGTQKDPLIGNQEDGGGRMTIHGHPPAFLGALPSFVTVRGGEYLIRPGLRALRWLASPR